MNRTNGKKEYTVKVFPLYGERRLIKRCREAKLEVFNPRGEWNGYGYTRLPLAVRIRSLSDMRRFNRIKRELDAEPMPPKRTADPAAKQEAWCRRLARLTGVSIEEARFIAESKLEYKYDQIRKMEERQRKERYSVQREKLIRKMERENPLRYIKDESHAKSILNAYERHAHSPYEALLASLHLLEEDGVIKKGTAKEWARVAMRREDPFSLLDDLDDGVSIALDF